MRSTQRASSTKEILSLLIARRKELGITLEHLAERAGYSKNTVHYWERGKRSPTLRNLSNWAQALGIRITMECENDPS